MSKSSPSLRNRRRDARLRAAERRGRLIVDDDGDLSFGEDAKAGREAFLAQRLYPLVDVGVKSVAWCIMWGIAQGPDETTYWQTQQAKTPLNDAITDPTPVMTEGARRAGMEIFASIRMNDTHDAFGKPHGRLLYPLKVEHPEWLLGDESEQGDFEVAPQALMWSGLDYSVPEVREDRLWWVRHSAESYVVDGVELNFFRMPWFFKRGEVAEGIPLMTDLIRKVRQIVDRESETRDTPMLLGVRVPGTVETCLRVGIDVEMWLREDLVDRLLIGGGYSPYTSPAEEMVRMAHDHDVPAYPCINCSAPGVGSDTAMRGAASNVFWTGADGIYLWNYHYRDVPMLGYGRPEQSAYELLREIGSQTVLAYSDKAFGVEGPGFVGPYAIGSHPTQLPLDLGRRGMKAVKSVRLRIGDDLGAARRAGRLDRAVLELSFTGIQSGDCIGVQINGSLLRSTACAESGAPDDRSDRRCYDVPAHAVKPGDNTLTLWIDGRSSQADSSVTLTAAWVHVTYR